MKTLAISGSIIYSSVIDHYVLGGPLTGQMLLAGAVTLIAIMNYSFDSTAPESAIKKIPNEGIRTEGGVSGKYDADLNNSSSDVEEGWTDSEDSAPVLSRRK